MLTFQGISYYEAPTAQILPQVLEAKRNKNPGMMYLIQAEPGADQLDKAVPAKWVNGHDGLMLVPMDEKAG